MNKDFISVRLVEELKFCRGRKIADKIFDLNLTMDQLYPDKKRYILEGIQLFKCKGEIFDLSTEPPLRQRFSFGEDRFNLIGDIIASHCIACELCMETCPVNIISEGEIC